MWAALGVRATVSPAAAHRTRASRPLSVVGRSCPVPSWSQVGGGRFRFCESSMRVEEARSRFPVRNECPLSRCYTLYMNMHMCTTSRIPHANLGMQEGTSQCVPYDTPKKESSPPVRWSARWRKAPAVLHAGNGTRVWDPCLCPLSSLVRQLARAARSRPGVPSGLSRAFRSISGCRTCRAGRWRMRYSER